MTNTLARQLIRLHAAAIRVPRTTCWWCLRPLVAGLCDRCDR